MGLEACLGQPLLCQPVWQTRCLGEVVFNGLVPLLQSLVSAELKPAETTNPCSQTCSTMSPCKPQSEVDPRACRCKAVHPKDQFWVSDGRFQLSDHGTQEAYFRLKHWKPLGHNPQAQYPRHDPKSRKALAGKKKHLKTAQT